MKELIQRSIDGMIISPCNDISELIPILNDTHIPVVFADRPGDDHADFVGINNENEAFKLLQNFTTKVKRVVVVCPSVAAVSTIEKRIEGTLRAELAKVYEQARHLASRNTILETQHLQQQNLISDWERRWKDREYEDIQKGRIVAKTPSIGSYNYSEFATGCETSNAEPAILLHNVPQSQLDIQQSLLTAEAALAGEKQQRSLLQQQIESAQKSYELKLDQIQHRIQFQESQILDLEQQLSSLYAAFGIVQQERTEERDQKL
jgi:hypothetical protein